MTRPATVENKADELYLRIRERICLLQYAPGTQLKEETLAQEYGVSRTPIRQALHRLEYDELVTSTTGKGYTVTTVDLRSLKEVYSLRLKLAEFTGEMMKPRFPDEDTQTLSDLLAQCRVLRSEAMNQVKIGQLYHAFNSVMVENIANRPLRTISDRLFYQTSRVWLDILPDFDWQSEVDIMCEEISDVIEAIQREDMIAVGQVRRDHMVRLLHRINDYLGSAEIS